MASYRELALLLTITLVISSPVPNPDEASGRWQGDIQLTVSDLGRTGILDAARRWPNGVIPYVIEGHTATYRANIRNAMIHISTLTCIKFVERKSETDYVRITNGATGCWSYIGKIGGGQIVNLQSSAGCALMGVAAHELLHAIGFHHAQSDINRNQYVRVNYENVVSGQEHNFEMYSNNYVTDYGEGYDFGSILHYSRYAFSKNGKTTIDPLISGMTIGQRNALSAKDASKVNKMYNCGAVTLKSLQSMKLVI